MESTALSVKSSTRKRSDCHFAQSTEASLARDDRMPATCVLLKIGGRITKLWSAKNSAGKRIIKRRQQVNEIKGDLKCHRMVR